jgi:8-oxo-dGTP diphosphatase
VARTHVRVTAFITRGNKVLIIHRFRDGKYYWVVPGGGVEEGESLLEGLVREVKEETGLDVLEHKLIDHSDSTKAFYFVKTSPGEPTLGGPELDANSSNNQYTLTWMERSELKSLKNIYPGQSPSLVDKIPYED